MTDVLVFVFITLVNEVVSVFIFVVKETLMISSFVFTMMLVIEYLNVITKGGWGKKLRNHKWGQYFVTSFLGLIPGCLGSFAAVSLYTHRIITTGALLAGMIATTGDDAFVMLTLFPGKAVLLFGILLVIGVASSFILDLIGYDRTTRESSCPDTEFVVHQKIENISFSGVRLMNQWRSCSFHRATLSAFLLFFLLGVVSGEIGPDSWNWIRVTLTAVACVGLFIISTVPDHFLEEHLWEHIAKKHLLRIFLWTAGALFAMHILVDLLNLDVWIQESSFLVLVIACLVGLIPQSGPHLIFVTFFAQGTIPFSVLLANSIVQDGHGMLPLLAHSRREFLIIKSVKLGLGLIIGTAVMLLS